MGGQKCSNTWLNIHLSKKNKSRDLPHLKYFLEGNGFNTFSSLSRSLFKKNKTSQYVYWCVEITFAKRIRTVAIYQLEFTVQEAVQTPKRPNMLTFLLIPNPDPNCFLSAPFCFISRFTFMF